MLQFWNGCKAFQKQTFRMITRTHTKYPCLQSGFLGNLIFVVAICRQDDHEGTIIVAFIETSANQYINGPLFCITLYKVI